MKNKMTVGELIELLQDYDEDMEVGFMYNYGDYWRTNVVQRPTKVFEEYVTYSSYHRMDKQCDEEELREVDDETSVTKIEEIIVIS